jgi:hypothetical protein
MYFTPPLKKSGAHVCIQESHYDLPWQVLDESSYPKDPMS